MSMKRVFQGLAVVTIGVGFAACHAEAKVGASTTPAPATPTPPAPAPAPTPAPAPKPIKAMGRAKIVGNQIQMPGKIHFDFDKATLKTDKETNEILDTVQKVLVENPHITKLRIEGYTDDKGALDHNTKLSQDRADSVAKWLEAKQIDQGRLVTIGLGPANPVSPNDSEAHREDNRRTQFTIWEIDGQPTDAAKNDTSGAATATASTATAGTTTTTSAKPTSTSTAKPTPTATAKKP